MGSEGQNGGNSPISSFVMPPMTEVQVSRLFSSLNVQKSSLDVPNKLTRPSVRVHWVACGTCTVPNNFFQGHQEVIPEEALWLGAHTLPSARRRSRRNLIGSRKPMISDVDFVMTFKFEFQMREYSQKTP